MPMATATATRRTTNFCLSFLSQFLVCCWLGLRFLCYCLGLGASFNADGDVRATTPTLCFSFLSLFLVWSCLSLRFHTEQSFEFWVCDFTEQSFCDGDEGNGDLQRNGDLLLLCFSFLSLWVFWLFLLWPFVLRQSWVFVGFSEGNLVTLWEIRG